MAKKPVDIVLVNYNAEGKLLPCVESIYKHTDPSLFQLTFVDNLSTDGSLALVKKIATEHDNVRVMEMGANLGFSGAANAALAAGGPDKVLFLDDDAEVTKGWLEGLLKTFDSYDNVGVVGCKIIYPNGQIFSAENRVNEIEIVGAGEPDRGQRDYVRECDSVVGTCWLMPRDLLQKVGPWDERFWPCQFEDIDYCMQARLKGFKVIYDGSVTIIHHHLFRNLGRWEENVVKFREKWKVEQKLFPLPDGHPADYHHYRARMAAYAGWGEEALAHIARLKALDERYNDLFLEGIAYEALKNDEQAEALFKQALAQNPSHHHAQYHLVNLYQRLGKTAEYRDAALNLAFILKHRGHNVHKSAVVTKSA